MIKKRSTEWRNYTVAVTGINARADNPGPGLAVARSIKESKEFTGRTIGLGYDVLDAGLYKKESYDSGYLIPYPASGEQALLERLEEINALEKIDVIIPCLDSEMTNFIRIRQELKEMGIKMFIPTRQNLLMREKNGLPALCKQANVATPKTKLVTDARFFEDPKDSGFKYPFILKGNFYDAHVVYNKHDALLAFNKLVNSWGYPVLAQKLIKGDEYNLTAIGDGAGSMLGEVMMRKRAITEKGKAWAGVTISDPDTKMAATAIMEELKWRGPFELEAIKEEDGTLNIIEFNPRFPSWIYTSVGVGRNLPEALLKIVSDPDSKLNFPAPVFGLLFVRYAEELLIDMKEFESVFVNGSTNKPIKKYTA